MNEKGLPPSLDEALAKVNPERRRLLGMLLAGAAALPLLTSAELVAGEGMGMKGVNSGPPSPPTFSPAAGTYSKPQTVTINIDTSGVKIFYTSDGSTPTTSSAKYTGPITVSSTKTIKAIGNLNNVTSVVGTATYTITGH